MISKESKKDIIGFFAGLIVIGLITTIIHELAHYMAAWLLGVPTYDIQVHFYPGYGFGINVPENSINVDQLRIFHYAGGLSAGFITLCFYSYLAWRYYRTNSQFVNGLSIATVIWITIQFTWGYYEGGNFAVYVKHAYIKQLVMTLSASAILHLIIFCLLRRYRRKKLQNR